MRSPFSLRALLVALLLLLTAAPAAAADLREVVVDLPRDAPVRLDDGPREPDVQHVRIAYDSAGTYTATVRLWEPWAQTDQTYDSIRFRLGTRFDEPEDGDPGWCSDIWPGDTSIGGSFKRDDPYTSKLGYLFINGLEGALTTTPAVSPDVREITFTLSTPHGANRPYVCASFDLAWLTGSCNLFGCRGNMSTVDEVVRKFPVPKPPAPPKPVCSNGADDDGDGLADLLDPGCKGRRSSGDERDPAPAQASFRFTRLRVVGRACELDVAVEVQPDIGPVRLFPFKRVELTVRKIGGPGRGYRVTRRLPLDPHPGYGFRLRPGRYRVSGSYPGDRFRLKTAVVSRTVTVGGCRPRR